MKERITLFVSGFVFSLGLAVSGMTRPAKVVGFLDVAGRWDASLALVMGGAVGLNLLVFRLVLARRGPVFGAKFHLPVQQRVDHKLLLGSALFGVGWGLAGYCPGPAVLSLVTGHLEPLLFVAAMLFGFLVSRWMESPSAAPVSTPDALEGQIN